ncbi:GGDEF domain-containing protein [Parasalinivibrio latis]|uniref:GGDEF domain-containing protein n=1 Tax=Parasalinivibrio latis TaxID=2952610 RepID=UPI0030E511CE
MKVSSIEVLHSVVDITAHTESDAMYQSLVTTILQLTHVEQAFIVDVEFGGSQRFLIRASSSAQQFGDNELKILDKILNKSLFSMDNQYFQLSGKDSVLIPILIKQKLYGWVMCLGQNITEEETVLISGLSKVYENFISIISASERDSLTGLYNRKVLDSRLTELLADVSVSDGVDQKNWLLIIDIDNFKHINDDLGHIYGDDVLLLIVALLKQLFGKGETLFRYGGDEFLALMGPCTYEQAWAKADQLRTSVENRCFGTAKDVTVSIGMTAINTEDYHPVTVVGHADTALHHAKSQGRNRISVYGDMVKQGLVVNTEPEDDVELF